MSVIATFAPSLASNSEIAAPIPLAPPVTTTTFPSTLPTFLHPINIYLKKYLNFFNTYIIIFNEISIKYNIFVKFDKT
jgi:hypothetical protein